MFIPSSWAKLTGWKAVLAAIPIMAIICYRVWITEPCYRPFAAESVEVPQGKSYFLQFHLKKKGKVKAEVSDMSGGDYVLYILTGESMKKLDAMASSGNGDPKEIPTVMERQSNSNESIVGISLKAGEYYIVLENLGEKGIRCKLTLAVLE